jgi:hypothetical protein
MSLKAIATSRCSGGPVSSARLEVALLDAAGGSREVAQRPRERAGEEPCDQQTDQEREGADPDQDENAAANAVPDGIDVLRHTHRADDTDVRHWDGGVEQVLPERDAVTLPLRPLS